MKRTINIISIDTLFTSLAFTVSAVISIKVLSIGTSELLTSTIYFMAVSATIWGAIYRNKLFTCSLHNQWVLALMYGVAITFLTAFSVATAFSLLFIISPTGDLTETLSIFSIVFMVALFTAFMATPFGMAASIIVYYKFKLSNKSLNRIGAKNAPPG